MSLFKRSVVSEIINHFSVVLSTLIVVWLSVILVRLLGEAAAGRIGADVVIGLAAFTTIAALPIILAVSIFIGVLTTITRNFRESEMVVWFSSGLSLLNWINPVMRVTIPVAILIASLTMFGTPWANQQIGEYRARFELRSDLSKITPGQFLETEGGARVFFVEGPSVPDGPLGQVFMRIIDQNWLTLITSSSADTVIESNGDKFLVLGPGQRYDIKPGAPEMRLSKFDAFGARIESKDGEKSLETARERTLASRRSRPTALLLTDNVPSSLGQLMWRLAVPLAALSLALMAIPLGAVNPRMGRSGDLLIAGLIAMLYLNLINISQGWIISGKLSFSIGVWLVHGVFGLFTVGLLWHRLRVKLPKPPVVPSAA
ncbi:MAG: LPS export ABC transporter permease LptF [Burkholderiaceae bacterium]|jgi:lipopolysaccharide export system permease protein|nr:LPS export ABC transporter permease LptF [Burkholderiaceae bacterium]MDP4970018.1 LPS export ABC transporter permease LptF [Burkholderiaceae bacterium]